MTCGRGEWERQGESEIKGKKWGMEEEEMGDGKKIEGGWWGREREEKRIKERGREMKKEKCGRGSEESKEKER